MEVRVTRRKKFSLMVTEGEVLKTILGHKTLEMTEYAEMCLKSYLIIFLNFKVMLTN
jgi:hypothetical protein